MKKKLLILIVVYNHEKIIEKVLNRIDDNLINKFDVEDIDISEPPIDEIIGKLLINKQ